MYRRLFILLFFIFGCNLVFSQEGNYQFRSLMTSDGLSQSTVISIHQDKIGQMWFGTRDGLNIYDGSSFKIFRHIPSDTTTISNSDILSLEEDVAGNIWVGTYDGLNKYDPVTNVFKKYFHTSALNSLSNNTIWCIKEIKDEIWMGTSNGISIYSKTTGDFRNILNLPGNSSSIPSNFVVKIIETTSGDIWVGTSKGISKLRNRDTDHFDFQNYAIPMHNGKTKDAIFVQDILESNKDLWIASKADGIFKYDHIADQLISPLTQNHDLDVRALGLDKNSNLWIGTYSSVYVVKEKEALLQEINRPVKNKNLSKIKSIFRDKKGSIWIGSYYGGVHFYDESNSNFTNIDQNYSKVQLSYNVVGSIASDIFQNIYFGTEGGGITLLNKESGNVSYINKSNTKGLSTDNLKTLFQANDEDLWIGTFVSGVHLYNVKQKKITDNKLGAELPKLLEGNSIYAIKKDHKGSIWLGTFGSGLIRFNPEDKSISSFKYEEDNLNSISNNRVRSLLIDSQHRIWIGTQSGLNLMHANDGNKKRIKRFFYDEQGLSGGDISTIFEDSSENIWVAIKAKGLYLLNGDAFKKVPVKNGALEISSIHSILEDINGNLWLSSNKGIVQFNPSSNETTQFSQADGLISNEFNNNSNLRFDNNTFYFGGPAGVSSFNPQKITINQYSPQVILTDLKVKNKSISVNDGDEPILSKSISHTKDISLNYDMANFAISFAIPNFINASNNSYAYRMVGLNNEWTTTNKTEAFYTIQNPGTYIFEVKGANNDGVWNETSTQLEIIVRPAPWRSPWAFLIYFILIAGLLIILNQFLKSKAKLKHALEVEHLELERNEEINKTKLQFFTNISHEFRTPLTLILGPLQQILTDYKGSNKMYKKLLVIESSATHLLQLINRLMDFRKLESNQFHLESANGNIIKFLQEIYLSFTEYAKDGNYTYTFNSIDEEILVYYDRSKLERVFYNLISNAFRYTPEGGTISIHAKVEDKQLLVEIEDNGVGISEDYIDKIFDRFFEVPLHNKPQENYNKGTGIGLSIANNMVKLHKGSIHVMNKNTSGVIFTVKLPLGKEHLEDTEILTDFKISDDLAQYEIQLNKNSSPLKTELSQIVKSDDRPTILIAEDNTPLRSFINNLLSDEYNIIEAENGEVALKKALQNMPDLIISDIIMPIMVGTELCAKIKENLKTSHIPVILLTSRSSLIYKFEGLESGADEYISKPFNIKEFKLKIKNMLNSVARLKEKFSVENNFSPSDIAVSSMDETLLKKAFKIVELNIENDQFDIPFFCAELGVSRTMLFTKIKAWTNFTPNEFIQEIRMKRAAQLLEQNKINVSQVCYKVGFRNPKYFSKCFQKKFGETPTQYQNKFSDTFSS